MSHNITREQRPQLEQQRRESLARHLIHSKPKHQQMYLKSLKSDTLREELRELMKQELAKEIALMDTHLRNLRLSRLKDRCSHKEFDSSFFRDIQNRVDTLLASKETGVA
ncbi:hypothetical protein [Endozoicomonas lisbonensis]|uniref:Uncharacterized protein n=1 Tax=Endozoicomonas lisbonensis TaxID=3120522 RepID=A0ABV2SGT6_9GAMM